MEMNEGPIGIQQKALMPSYFEKVKVERTGICQMGVSKNRGTPKWMIYNGNLY